MEKKKGIRIGENEKMVLKTIGIGVFVVASLAIPNLPLALQPIIKARGNKGLQKLLKNLERKRFIYLGGEKIKLTTKGRKMLREIQVSDVQIEPMEKWDGIWHLVAYDIPEIYRESRNILREVLERNNFYQIQKSLWACPYNCEEEIAILLKNLNLSEFVVFLTTDKLSNQKEMMGYFNLRD